MDAITGRATRQFDSASANKFCDVSGGKLGNVGAIEKQTDFSVVYDTLTLANMLASRVEALADCLLGCYPQTGQEAAKAHTPSGILPIMAQSADHARCRIGDAMAALERIERALP